MNEFIEQAKKILAMSFSTTVLTGAGISAESGISTYRDSDGLWNNYRAEDFSSVEAFNKDPETVWNWYHARRASMALASPNAAHRALVEMAAKSHRFRILTQNIDGLHQRAGSSPVIELHGSVWKLECTVCDFEWESRAELTGVPKCLACGEIARPAVTWFGESLNPAVWISAELAARCDTMLVVGSSMLVDPVASIPLTAKKRGARIIEVNLEESGITPLADISIRGKAGEILPQLVATEPVDIQSIGEADMGAAMMRGMNKFYEKYPQFRPTNKS